MTRFNWSDDTPIYQAVYEALGLASMCWSDPPTGVFDDQLASEIGEELVDLIQRKQLLTA